MSNEAVADNSIKHSFSLKKFIGNYISTLFYLSVGVLIFIGWKNKGLSNLTPESGAGYWLGIIGGSLMLLLLLYPLRKKVRFLDRLGKIKYWFKIHMFLGIIGPVAILFHANFSLGSTNSNIAFFCMVIVSLSGLIGRYLYAKIHHGLYGRKANLKELRESLKESRGKLGNHFTLTKKIVTQIKKLERFLLRNRNIVLATFVWPYIFMRTWWARKSIRKNLRKTFIKAGREKGWDRKMVKIMSKEANEEIQPYVDGLYEMYGFRIFEGLFSLWHFLHLPLFVMLIFTGIVHVIVVHSY